MDIFKTSSPSNKYSILIILVVQRTDAMFKAKEVARLLAKLEKEKAKPFKRRHMTHPSPGRDTYMKEAETKIKKKKN